MLPSGKDVKLIIANQTVIRSMWHRTIRRASLVRYFVSFGRGSCAISSAIASGPSANQFHNHSRPIICVLRRTIVACGNSPTRWWNTPQGHRGHPLMFSTECT